MAKRASRGNEKNASKNASLATEARKEAVVCVELGEYFESASEASRHFDKTSQSKITMCCQGQRKTSGGYHWMYKDEYDSYKDKNKLLEEINKKSTHRPQRKRVLCVETNEIFESVTAAALNKNLSLYTIAECCRNQKNNNYTCGGYHWRYLDE